MVHFKIRIMKCKILVACVLLAMVFVNVLYIREKLPEIKTLGLFNIAVLAADEEGGSSGSGMCTERAGYEQPKEVLLNNTCTKSVKVQVGTSFVYESVAGNECKCKRPPRSYRGAKGCNLSWETACK